MVFAPQHGVSVVGGLRTPTQAPTQLSANEVELVDGRRGHGFREPRTSVWAANPSDHRRQMNKDAEFVRARMASLKSELGKLPWREGAWKGKDRFPFRCLSPVRLQRSQQLMNSLVSHPVARTTGDEAHWKRLIAIGASYTEIVCSPVAGAGDDIREAMIAWLTYFWHLDTVVDEYRALLPSEDALRGLRESVEEAWDRAGDARKWGVGRPARVGVTASLADLASVFLGRHLELLRARGLSDAALAPYRESVSEHIRSQLSPDWLFRRFDSLDDYLHCRKRQSGMECILKALITLTIGECPTVAQPLVELANLSTSLTNDLFSYDRDMLFGTATAAMFVADDHAIADLAAIIDDVNRRMLDCALDLAGRMELRTWSALTGAVVYVVTSMVEWHFVEPRYEAGARSFLDHLGYRGSVPTLDVGFEQSYRASART
jgi:hypothetical protein